MFFINILSENPLLYFALLGGIVLSIVLHELAHGYVAIKLGDDTPIRLKRMTFNPMVNLGPVSLILLAIFGMGWGSMPVDRSRLRGRYGDLWVSLAGPATNLVISILFIILLIALDLFKKHAPESTFPFENANEFCNWMAWLNMFLTLFNLFPIPPLDGCNALMSLDAHFREFVSNNLAFQQFGFLGLIILINITANQPFGLPAVSITVVRIILGVFERIASILF
jgi:Zn-dependent protease